MKALLLTATTVACLLCSAGFADAQYLFRRGGNTYSTQTYSYPTYSYPTYSYPAYSYAPPSYFGGVVTSGYSPAYSSGTVIYAGGYNSGAYGYGSSYYGYGFYGNNSGSNFNRGYNSGWYGNSGYRGGYSSGNRGWRW